MATISGNDAHPVLSQLLSASFSGYLLAISLAIVFGPSEYTQLSHGTHHSPGEGRRGDVGSHAVEATDASRRHAQLYSFLLLQNPGSE